MAAVIGGNDVGVLDSSLYLLNRDDRTGGGEPGHGESVYINVSNGNLILQHVDGYLPSQGEDFSIVRTYNSHGMANDLGRGWTISTPIELKPITAKVILLVDADGSEFRFERGPDGRFVSVDGAGAYEVIEKGDISYEALIFENGTYRTERTTIKGFELIRSDGTRLIFDNNGTLLQSRDTSGNVIQYEYSSNRLSRVLDDQGHVISYHYDGSDLVRIEDSELGVLVSYEYDQNGLTRVIDRAGHITEYEYFGDGRLSAVRLPAGEGEAERVLRFEYQADPTDNSGTTQLLRTFYDADGNPTRFEYAFTQNNHSNYTGGTAWMVDAYGVNRAESNDAEYVQWRLANGYYAQWDEKSYTDGLFLDPKTGKYKFDAVRWEEYVTQADAVRRERSTMYTFDAEGAITSVSRGTAAGAATSFGYRTEYLYDDRKNLVAVIDANGWAITHSDDPYWRDMRRELGIIDSKTGEGKSVADLSTKELADLTAHYTTRFEYDGRGNLVKRSDADGNVVTFTYTDFNKLASETSAVGHALVTSDDPYYQERRAELGYAARASQLSNADRQALLALHTTSYTYDERERLIEQRMGNGELIRFDYDSYGNLVRKVVYLDAADLGNLAKQQVTRYEYDAYGNNVRTVEGNAWLITHSDEPYWRTMRAEFGIVDGNGDGKAVAELTDTERAQLEGRYTSRASYDLFGNRLTHTDANGGITRYTYDDDNQLLTVTGPNGNVTVYAYDAVGNRIAVTDANGHTIVYLYNRNNQLIAKLDPADGGAGADRTTEYRYDVVGDRTAVVDAKGRKTQYVYSADRRLVEVVTPETADADGNPVSYRTVYEYDAHGNRTRVVDRNGSATDYVYRPNGALWSTTDRQGNVTTYQYDADGNRIQIVIGAQLATELRRILQYRYDESDRLIAEMDAEGFTTRYGYDQASNRIQVVDAEGRVHHFAYDAQNRRIVEQRPAVIDPATGEPVAYTVEHYFDGNGNELATVDENGARTRIAYDGDNRAVLIEDPNGVKTVFRYDAVGNRIAVVIGADAHVEAGRVVFDDIGEARTTTYRYDEFNQLVARTDGVGNALAESDDLLYRELRRSLGYVDAMGEGKQAADLTEAEQERLRGQYTERYAYDRVGNRTEVVDALNRSTRFEYDALDRLVERNDALGGRESYRYDGNGNRVAVIDPNGHALVNSDDGYYQTRRVALGYARYIADLTLADRQALLAHATTRLSYDREDRLVDTVDPQGVTLHREYDNVGNLVAETRAFDTDEARRNEYVYDLNNRLTAQTDPEGATRRYEYDAVGNRLRAVDGRGYGTDLVYDALNRTVRVIDPLGFETRYEYDGVGNRLAVIDARGGITRFDYDPGRRLVATTDAEGRVTEYGYDRLGQRISQTTAAGTPLAQTTVFEYDAEGNLRAVIDAEGGRTEHAYDAVYNRLATTDALGHTAAYAFDALNRRIEVLDAEGGLTTYRFDAADNRIGVTDAVGHALAESEDAYYRELRQALGFAASAADLSDADRQALRERYTTHFAYDTRHQLITETRAGVVNRYAYDAVGNRIDLVRAAGTDAQEHVRYTYDRNDRLIASVDGHGNALAESDSAYYRELRQAMGYPVAAAELTDAQRAALRDAHTTRTAYDESGNAVRRTDALGRTTEYVYDANNRVVAITDPLGVGLAESDAAEFAALRQALGLGSTAADLSAAEREAVKAAHRTSYTYDGVGNRLQITDPLGHTTTSYYNLDGELIAQVDPEGAVVRYDYDANGNRVGEYRYANRIVETDPSVNPTPAGSDDDRLTRYAYDRLNRVTHVLAPSGTLSSTRYDAVGNVLERTTHAVSVAYEDGLSLAAQEPPAHAQDRTARYGYDALGRQVLFVDAAGGLTAHAYDAVGNRTATTLYAAPDATGSDVEARHSTFVYDTFARLVGSRNAGGIETRFDYDAAGRQLARIDGYGLADARTTQWEYDAAGRRVAQVDALGIETRFVHDAAGQLVRRIDGYNQTDARVTRYGYDANGRLALQIDALDAETRFVYDAAGHQIAQHEAWGLAEQRTTYWSYDGNGRIDGRIDAEGHPTAYAYNAFGEQVSITDALGGVSRSAYDLDGRLAWQVDADGAVTEHRYDVFGDRSATVRYAAVVDPRLDITPPAVVADPARDVVLRFAFDALGREVRRIDAEGYVTDTVYNRFGEVVAQTAFATPVLPGDSPLAGLAPEPDNTDRTVSFTYDNLGQRTGAIDAEGFSTTWGYDAYGNRTQVVAGLYLGGDPLLAALEHRVETRYRYDALDRLVGETLVFADESESIATAYTYDGLGNLLTKVEADGSPDARIWRYGYDLLGRQTEAVAPDDVVTRRTYDALGRLSVVTEATGTNAERHTRFEYDGNDHPVRTVYADGNETRNAYDALGRLVVRTDAPGTSDERQTTYAYDRLGRLTAETLAAGTAAATTTTFAYDAYGNRIGQVRGADTADARTESRAYDRNDRLVATVDGNGVTTVYGYDAFGNRISQAVTDRASGHTAAVSLSYDGRNLLIEERNAEGEVVRRRFDAAGNLIRELAGEQKVAITDYRYDEANRLVTKTQYPGGEAEPIVTEYGYDGRGNLVREMRGGIATVTEYDVMDRAVRVTEGGGYATAFTYDDFGNQVAITTGLYEGTDPSKAKEATTRYAYDARDRQVLQADALGVVTRYEYDARGNRVRETQAYGFVAAEDALVEGNIRTTSVAGGLQPTAPRISIYTYDAADRLVQERQPAGTLIAYSYTAAGERKSKTVDVGGTGHLNAATSYFYDAGGRLAYEADPLGSLVRYQYDDFGNVVRETRGLAFDAFGRPSAEPTAAMRVTSREYDLVGRLMAETVDPDGLALHTAYEYDEHGNRTAIIDAEGHRGESAFDAVGRVIWQRDGEGYVTTFAYDARGNKLAETHYALPASGLPAGEAPAAHISDRTVGYTYDARDKLLTRTDAAGIVNQLEYDAVGNVVREIQNAGSAAPRITEYSYDLANMVTVQREHVAADGGDIPGVTLTTAYTYDAVYNVVEKAVTNGWSDTLADGAATTETVQTAYAYDLNNRLTDEIVDVTGLALHTGYRYDGLGNRIAAVSPNGYAALEGQALTPAQQEQLLAEYTTRTWFDEAGRARFTIDPLGYVREVRYDALGQMVEAIQYADPLAVSALKDGVPPNPVANATADRRVEYRYDGAGREIEVSLDPVTAWVANGTGGYEAVIDRPTVTKVYDGLGNLVRETDANGYSTYHYYDSRGFETATLDAEGYLTVNDYTAFGDLAEERHYLARQPLTAEQAAALDPASYQPAGEVRITTHAYNTAGHAINTRYPSTTLYVDGQLVERQLEVDRTFDAFGNVLSETVAHAVDDQAPATRHFRYDTAGRLVSESDPRNALDVSTYAYDAAGHLREKVEGGRVTTFVYDRAGRNTTIHFPAYEKVTVDSNGDVQHLAGHRPVGMMEYDAAGNLVREIKVDGSDVHYVYDTAGRQVGAIDPWGIYTEYGYDFAGDRLFMRRYATPVSVEAKAPPAKSDADQLITFQRDRLGRVVTESQHGDLKTTDDDRVTQFGYDAAGQQVRIIDSRATSLVFYDALGRVSGTVNPAGGLTATLYDRDGNVISRQTGGSAAPSLVGNQIRQPFTTSDGAYLEWITDLPTDGTVYVRPAGSGGVWSEYGVSGAYGREHGVLVSGLSAGTEYEFTIASKDAFGNTLTTDIKSFTTAAAVGEMVIADLHEAAPGVWEATVTFALPADSGEAEIVVDEGGATSRFAATSTGGSYQATLTFADPDSTQFRVEWIDAGGARVTTLPEAVRQEQRLSVVDIETAVQPGGLTGTQHVSVLWHLPSGAAASYEEEGETWHQVYLSYTTASGESWFEQARPASGGGYAATLLDLPDTAGSFSFFYVEAGTDRTVYVDVPVSGPGVLAGHTRRLDLAFGGIDVAGAGLSFRYREAGSDSWQLLPAAAVSGFTIDVGALPGGEYEFEAVASDGAGLPLATSRGRFTLETAHTVGDLVDAVQPETEVAYTLDGNRLAFTGLALEAGDSLTLRLVGADGSEHVLDASEADLALLPSGDYQLHLVHTREITTTVEGPDGEPVETTETQILADITGGITVAPARLLAAEADALSGRRQPAAAVQDNRSYNVIATVSDDGTDAVGDHTFNVHDTLGRKVYSNENGGVWTRYDYDAQGNVTREVRFRWQDDSGTFLDHAPTPQSVPSRTQLDARLSVALAAAAQGEDTVRITTRTYDAAGNLLSETRHSPSQGDVTDRFEYDRYGNRTATVTAAGATYNGQSVAQRTDTVYDAYDRVITIQYQNGTYWDEAVGDYRSFRPEVHTTYDGAGNKSTELDVRGNLTRYRYEGDRLVTEWGGADAAGQGSGLRTDYAYDGFGRRTKKTATDLTGRADVAVQVTDYTYTAFDELKGQSGADGSFSRTYDAGGNVATHTDALSQTERYAWDAENRLIARTDALGNRWESSYDGYGHLVSEIDPNGRVTEYRYGAFGQLEEKTVHIGTAPVSRFGDFARYEELQAQLAQTEDYWERWSIERQINALNVRSYSHLRGARQTTETTESDWLGRTVRVTDSFGRDDRYEYDDLDRITGLTRRTERQGAEAPEEQRSEYVYDAAGNRRQERLYRDDVLIREQTHTYNGQGWLTATEGGVLGQQVTVSYRHDAAGNRVESNGKQYTYDREGRMLSAYDAKEKQTVESLQYDGYGNRQRESRGETTVTHTYDGHNRITASSGGDAWKYDANGNVTEHTWGNGYYTRNTYDAAGRTLTTVSKTNNDPETSIRNHYDAAGNLAVTRIESSKYGFEEVSEYDVRYDVQHKYISRQANRVKGAKYLYGDSWQSYDVNGQLVYMNRGRPKDGKYDAIGIYRYDNEGHIIERADKAADKAVPGQVYGYVTDPTASVTETYYDWMSDSGTTTVTTRAVDTLARNLFADRRGSGWFTSYSEIRNDTTAQGYLYADGNPVAEVKEEQKLELKTLELTAATETTTTTVYGYSLYGSPMDAVTSRTLRVLESDIVTDASGQIDRLATATKIAERAYAGFTELGQAARHGIAAQIEGHLPATVAAGAGIPIAVPQTYTYEVYNGDSPNTVEERAIPGVTQGGLDAYLVVVDPKVNSKVVITDYAYQAIGGSDGLGGGSAKLHSVRAGDTLQGIASGYFGSSAYWYLIADANGLDGTEELKEGTRLIIPGTITNAVNDKGTFKVYDEQAIIGTDSPTVKVKQKSSSGGFFSSIIKILIVIIVIVVAVYVGAVAANLYQLAAGGVAQGMGAGLASSIAGGIGIGAVGTSAAVIAGTGAAYAAAAVAAVGLGYVAGVATSFATQGLAIMAGLQEGFDWKAMQDMGSNFAVTAVAGFAGGWATSTFGKGTLAEGAVKATIQAGRQVAENGRITNVSGIVMSMAPGVGGKDWGTVSKVAAFADKYSNVVGAGLSVVEASIKGDDQALSWTNFAAAAVMTGTGQSGAYFDSKGFDWTRIAAETLVNAGLGMVVADRFGEDAGLNFFGSAMGQIAASALQGYASFQAPVIAEAAAFTDEATSEGRQPQPGTSAPGSASAAAELKPHTVQQGDSIWGIAKSQLGDGATDAQIRQRTLELLEANQGIDPLKLQVGQSLNIPAAGISVGNETLAAYVDSDAKYQEDLNLRREFAAVEAQFAELDRAYTAGELAKTVESYGDANGMRVGPTLERHLSEIGAPIGTGGFVNAVRDAVTGSVMYDRTGSEWVRDVGNALWEGDPTARMDGLSGAVEMWKGGAAALRDDIDQIRKDPVGYVADAAHSLATLLYDSVEGPAYALSGGLVGDPGSLARNQERTAGLSAFGSAVLDAVQADDPKRGGYLVAGVATGLKKGKIDGVPDTGKYAVGPYKDIKGTVPGMDAHHVGQQALMKEMIPGYDPATAPAVLVPKVGHTIRGPNGIVSRSTDGLATPRDVLARDIVELRRVYPDIPNRQLQELIRLNKAAYPGAFYK